MKSAEEIASLIASEFHDNTDINWSDEALLRKMAIRIIKPYLDERFKAGMTRAAEICADLADRNRKDGYDEDAIGCTECELDIISARDKKEVV